jgi:hypothetical protein
VIQFNLSKDLAMELAMHVAPEPETRPAMNWFAHSVVIAGQLCVVVMEQQTRYAMVVCGLTSSDLETFPARFQDRLWREVFAICEEGNEARIEKLCQRVLSVSEKQCYTRAYDRSVQSHIRQVIHDLEYRVYEQGMALPVDSGKAFEFGVQINNVLRKRQDDNDYFLPIEAFRRYCLDLVCDDEQYRTDHQDLIAGEWGNVIAVDFRKGRR